VQRSHAVPADTSTKGSFALRFPYTNPT
jgi:hypothetical protein